MRQKYLIVTAGGSGTRMGSALPKQFIMLDGKPVLQLTISRFVEAIPDLKIIVVLPEDYIQVWKDLCYENNFSVSQIIVKGGLTRFHSVKNALEKIPSGALVAVHDGVRPFVSVGLIRSLFKAGEDTCGVVPAVPCVDTLRAVMCSPDGAGLIRLDDAPVDRNRVFAVQTPQIFHSEILKEAYRQAFDTSFTDDASVVEKSGTQVSYILGERLNIKITTPEDLHLAKVLMLMFSSRMD